MLAASCRNRASLSLRSLTGSDSIAASVVAATIGAGKIVAAPAGTQSVADLEPHVRLAAAIMQAPSASLLAIDVTGMQRVAASGVSWASHDDEPVAVWASRQTAPLAVLDTAAADAGCGALA